MSVIFLPSQLLFICCILYPAFFLRTISASDGKPNLPQCGPYERPVPCINRCNTCEYRFGGCSQIGECTPGCDCVDGFFRNKQGKCVPGPLCDGSFPGQNKTCGPYEVFSNCAPKCQRTCKNKNPVCTKECVKACVCVPGFIRDDFGKCIPEGLCPGTDKCGPYEVFSNCAPKCQRTCKNKNPVCTKECVKACVCIPGFIRDDFGKCIPEALCPGTVVCGLNSIRSNCASLCPPTCKIRNPYCAAVCVDGCICLPGFINDGFGNCIPEKQCPKPNNVCGQNEVDSDCVSPCNDCITRGKCQFIACNKGCDCKKGFRRNAQNICIPESQCPAGKCGAYELFSNCAPKCQRTCKNKNPVCTKECVKACVCVPGFIRDDFGKCIPEGCCASAG